MHYSTAIAAVAAFAPLVSAHGAAVPQIIGLNPRDLKTRDLLGSVGARFASAGNFAKGPENKLQARQDDRECGAGVGSCSAGLCCSPAGCTYMKLYTSRLKINDRQTAVPVTNTATPQAVTTNTAPDAPRTSHPVAPTLRP